MKKIKVGVYDYYWNSKTQTLFFDEAGKKRVPLAYFNNTQYVKFLDQISEIKTPPANNTIYVFKKFEDNPEQNHNYGVGKERLMEHLGESLGGYVKELVTNTEMMLRITIVHDLETTEIRYNK